MCGNEVIAKIGGLITSTLSCGCLNSDNAKRRCLSFDVMKSRIPGKSRLTAIKIGEPKYDKKGGRVTMLTCKCTCGTIRDFKASGVMSGAILSCGCMRKEIVSALLTKYPNANNKILSSYRAMIGRCTNHNNQAARLYIERGVRVCDEWLNDYFSFEKWSLDNGWKPGLVIDKDIKGNGMLYSPETCVWATPKENANKKSNSVYFNYMGESLTLSQVAERIGIKRATLDSRLRSGMKFNDAVNMPVQDKLLNLTYKNKNYVKS